MSYMRIFNKLRPFVLAGMVGCHAQAHNIERIINGTKSPDNASIAVMEYGRNHLLATVKDGKYERFEHTGYDGTAYCMQIFYLPKSIKAIDGIDGFCDEYADAYSVSYDSESMVYFCGKEQAEDERCLKINELVTIFKYLNSIDFIKSEWNRHRESCNEKKCSLVLKGKPDTMSKKKVK